MNFENVSTWAHDLIVKASAIAREIQVVEDSAIGKIAIGMLESKAEGQGVSAAEVAAVKSAIDATLAAAASAAPV